MDCCEGLRTFLVWSEDVFEILLFALSMTLHFYLDNHNLFAVTYSFTAEHTMSSQLIRKLQPNFFVVVVDFFLFLSEDVYVLIPFTCICLSFCEAHMLLGVVIGYQLKYGVYLHYQILTAKFYENGTLAQYYFGTFTIPHLCLAILT